MTLFDRIRRSRQKSVLPDEVRSYYQSEQRQRRGMAIVFALLGLLITIVVAVALFYGGRAIYNAVTKDDKTNQGQASSTSTNKPRESTGGATQNQAGTSQQATPQNQTNSSTQNNPASSPTVATPTPAPSSSQDLPRTGDEGM